MLKKFPDLYFLKSIVTSNYKRLEFPFKCSFAVTYRCNLKCKMCNIWKKGADVKEVTLEDIDSFFQKSRKFSWVGITGGEPFLREDISDIVDVIIKYSQNLSAIHFATNGLLSDRIVDKVANIKKKYPKQRLVFTVSIDGPPALHNSVRGVDNVWDKAVNTFKELKKMKGVKVQIGFTISEHNVGQFSQMYSALKSVYPKLEFDDINVNIFQKSGFYYDNEDMTRVDEEVLYKELKKIFSIDDKKGLSVNNFLRRTYLKLYPKYIKTGKTPVPCQALSSTLFIDPYGDLYPCAIYKRKLINIKDIKEDFGQVWNCNEAKKISKECKDNKCPVCWSPCDAFSAISGSLGKSIKTYIS